MLHRLIAKNVTKLVLDNEANLRDEVDSSLQSLLRYESPAVHVRHMPVVHDQSRGARQRQAWPATVMVSLSDVVTMLPQPGVAAHVHRSFNLLDDALEAAMDGNEKAAQKVDERMQATRDSMDRFDRSIRHCLHMSTA